MNPQRSLKCRLLEILAWFITLLGLLTLVTPLPGTVILLATGLSLLIYASPKMRLCIQWARSRLPWVHRSFNWLQNKIGNKIKVLGETLAKTQPLPDTTDKSLSHSEYVRFHLKHEQRENKANDKQ
ncbi:hypothetical protein [Gayadomonas joobiniege]|uniref:hypothetical protein n=1 Tax=Gayadomonas joobiniege TaxID=1234606 RepID=UPI000363C742|nr:hypothetical protein [Gayadomonas joobiniege]